MRTNIFIETSLINRAKKLSKSKTKKEVVNRALENYIKTLKRRELLLLEGKIKWEGDLKKMRSL
ncbi:MAG: type II toxin-antitoxin system VapB family antitoxin [Bacteroidota bacterium]|nr:type II toxin-antitoxin system VapB family antitoxin [Bacteroidota bacterium]